MHSIKKRTLIGLAILMWACLACPVFSQPQAANEATELDEEAVVRQYCATCHAFTEPDLLPKKSWQFLLSYMGFFLGVRDYSLLRGSSEHVMDTIEAREEFVREANLFPEEPILTVPEWLAIRNYFLTNAPEEAIPQISKPAIEEDSSLFEPKKTQFTGKNSITSLVHIDEVSGYVLVHDSANQRLSILNRDLEFHDAHEAPGVFLIEAESRENEIYLLNIGDLFASEIGKPYGEFQYAKFRSGFYYGMKNLIEDLHRPADFCFSDLNGNGVEELLVSNFGDYTGNLSLYKKNTRGEFDSEPQLLSAEPGIVQSEVGDFNNDGRQDILVLTSAGRESVSMIVNEGNGQFSQKKLVEAHPSFGYTGMVLRDFNEDGRMDFLTLNGDNADSDPYNTLKRDQGIRIYLNQGDLEFEEAYFYPMYGVYKAAIEDFDLDGDFDIAAISFFPDFYPEKPENFVLLEQTGPLEFKPKTHPATYNGRWLTMDAGDIDGDGDKDLILGAAYSPVGMRANHEEKYLKLLEDGPPLLVLDNKSIN